MPFSSSYLDALLFFCLSAYRVIVEGRAPAEARSIRGSVTIQTDVPGETDLVIPLSIIVR